ncbi:hypothetical protein KSP39_PZI020305 [Platanthera zijinensis]|uniref:MgsA AAA+ ATPase C-terminal domain-containing protein n=1 Tax=Platanthera zijinensis TaxID=2320716 RepID=A0AAP0B0Y3_9ASPA
MAVKDSVGGNEGVPLHLRNALTKMMKEMGYGDGYVYPPDHPQLCKEQNYMPESLKGRKFLQWPPLDNDEQYRCSETGNRLPFKCAETQDGSKEESESKTLRKLLFQASNMTGSQICHCFATTAGNFRCPATVVASPLLSCCRHPLQPPSANPRQDSLQPDLAFRNPDPPPLQPNLPSHSPDLPLYGRIYPPMARIRLHTTESTFPQLGSAFIQPDLPSHSPAPFPIARSSPTSPCFPSRSSPRCRASPDLYTSGNLHTFMSFVVV